MHRPLRIFYAAGPGDVVGTYRHWSAGRDDPSQVAVTYSAQFFDLCRSIGASGYVMSSHPRREVVREGAFRVEHRPIAFSKGPAALYHAGQLWSGLRMVASAARFRADAAVVSGGSTAGTVLPPVAPAVTVTERTSAGARAALALGLGVVVALFAVEVRGGRRRAVA